MSNLSLNRKLGFFPKNNSDVEADDDCSIPDRLVNIKTIENSIELSEDVVNMDLIISKNSIFTGPTIPKLKILSGEKKKRTELSKIEEANS